MSTRPSVSRERPKPPIIAISPNVATGRRLSIAWGIHCVVAEDARDQDGAPRECIAAAGADTLRMRLSASAQKRA
jgi:pyruvate kinase